MNGIFIIDKPGGMTSHDIVDRIRKQFNVRKVGHLGTLDPMATGVLPVCAGKATRIGQFIPAAPKEYSGEIRLGFATTTYDREGEPISAERPLNMTKADAQEAMKALTGAIGQIPPPYSAKKIGGVASYKLARRGKAVEMSPVPVNVEKFEMTRFEPPFIGFQVRCSPGTYVRSLAHDLGQRLGCGAHLTALRRTRSGNFTADRAVALDRISSSDLIPMEQLLDSWPRLEIPEAEENKVLHGHPIRAAAEGPFARMFNKEGEFIAVAAIENGWARPRVVLTSITSD